MIMFRTGVVGLKVPNFRGYPNGASMTSIMDKRRIGESRTFDSGKGHLKRAADAHRGPRTRRSWYLTVCWSAQSRACYW